MKVDCHRKTGVSGLTLRSAYLRNRWIRKQRFFMNPVEADQHDPDHG